MQMNPQETAEKTITHFKNTGLNYGVCVTKTLERYAKENSLYLCDEMIKYCNPVYLTFWQSVKAYIDNNQS